MNVHPAIAFAGACVMAFVSGCSACEPTRPPRPRVSASATAAPSAPILETSAAVERRSLPEREPLDVAGLTAGRADLVLRLDAARSLAKKDAREATPALVALAAQDPLGGLVASSLARAAAAAGDLAVAARAARVARAAAGGRDGLREDAAPKPEMGPPAAEKAAPAPLEDHATTLEQARSAVEHAVRSGKVPLVFSDGSKARSVDVAVDGAVEVESPTLKRAVALRVDVAGESGNDRLLWVALEGSGGVDTLGPIASVFSSRAGHATNDVIVDLQKIDVLPGGAPEIVVKVMERRTLPDVALNEVLEVDETRALLLTVDRGGIKRSAEVVLSSRNHRKRLDPKGAQMPRGFQAGPTGGRTTAFAMKVGWPGPNTMTLTKVSGNGEPPAEGEITLFP